MKTIKKHWGWTCVIIWAGCFVTHLWYILLVMITKNF